MEKIKLDIAGLSYSQTQSGAYALVLSEVIGKRRLPIIIGGFEAQAIAIELEKMTPSRPLTHDLFKDVLGQLGAKLKTVYLTELKDGIFYAQLNFEDGPAVSARPSDAIALALRMGSPILASDELLGEAGIEIPDQAEDEVERFKEFLDQINPEDFLG